MAVKRVYLQIVQAAQLTYAEPEPVHACIDHHVTRLVGPRALLPAYNLLRCDKNWPYADPRLVLCGEPVEDGQGALRKEGEVRSFGPRGHKEIAAAFVKESCGDLHHAQSVSVSLDRCAGSATCTSAKRSIVGDECASAKLQGQWVTHERALTSAQAGVE
jgi:hypothetical protein